MTADAETPLKRALGLGSLVLYGLGTIIGAGIYVLVGAVAGEAGMSAPLSFLLAGVLAGLTGLSYAELAARHPEAAGAAAFLSHGFDSPKLGTLTGFVICIIAVVAAASLARGGVAYLSPLLDISTPLAGAIVIAAFTAIACYGVVESVALAVILTAVEIGGLVLVFVIGAPALADLPARFGEMIPADGGVWVGVGAGAFLAFFAFAGFENLATMTEEARDGARTVPRAILLTIAISTVLYMAILTVAVLAVPTETLAGSATPLCTIVDCEGWTVGRLFPAVALTATLNGVLIEIIMAARVLYGMARRGWLPAAFARVHARRKTPVLATLLTGGIILALTVGLPFETLVRLSSGLLLAIFCGVNLSLARLHRTEPRFNLAVAAPRWAPIIGAISCLALFAAEALR